jgi:polysaccharide biosynthesis/export protein
MRVTRSVFLILAVAIAVAGCAAQPAPWLPVAAAPVVAMPPPPAGIDTMVYGSPARAAPARVAMPVVVSDSGRGFFTAAAAPLPPAYAPAPVMAPPPAIAAPPVYAPAVVAPVPAAFAPTLANKPYTLDSGDRLRIVVFGQDGLSNSYVVDASGYIAMPLIGTVLARGATTEQLSSRIAEKLRQGFVKEPHVAVEIEAYRPFFILGEVTQPGQYPYVADMTVETAVAIAGGFGPRAFRKTVCVTRLINGEQVQMTVPTSFPLRPGDTVNVQERWF